MKLLFLDIDGVLNGHEKHPGSVYCGIRADCMAELNRVIMATGCNLVITSAWRYQIHGDTTTLRGFEYLLASHGLILPRTEEALIIGITRRDRSIEITDRGEQTMQWLGEHGLHRKTTAWAVLDDDPMQMQLGDSAHRLVKTDGTRGLTPADADRVIAILNG